MEDIVSTIVREFFNNWQVLFLYLFKYLGHFRDLVISNNTIIKEHEARITELERKSNL